METQDPSLLWIVVIAFIVAFTVAFGIGANDVANSFGTTVGAKVLSLFEACALASIFELSGAILIGARVSDTVREDIVNSRSFNGTENLVMAGAFSALSGTSCWLIAATFLSLPVSATHGIVGGTLGYALVEYGTDGVQWHQIWKIAASWVISPVLSGAVSSLFYVVIKVFVLSKENSFEAGLKSIAVFYGLTVAVNFFAILYRGSHVLGMQRLPLYAVLIMSFGSAFLVALVVHLVVRPWLRRKIERQIANRGNADLRSPRNHVSYFFNLLRQKLRRRSPCQDELELQHFSVANGFTVTVLPEGAVENEGASHFKPADDTLDRPSTTLSEESRPFNSDQDPVLVESDRGDHSTVPEDPRTGQLFAFLQILMASFGAFAHGGNDVSNAVGPLTQIWGIYHKGTVFSPVDTPVWMLLFGGIGIVTGLCIWGRKVIKTLGEDLTPITPLSGFTIEIGSALTVLIASNLGIPISTTHCKVGSVVAIGFLRSRNIVNWRLFATIVLAWIVTMPCSGGMAAAVYAAVRQAMY